MMSKSGRNRVKASAKPIVASPIDFTTLFALSLTAASPLSHQSQSHHVQFVRMYCQIQEINASQLRLTATGMHHLLYLLNQWI